MVFERSSSHFCIPYMVFERSFSHFCSGGFWGAKTNLGRLWVDFGEAPARVWEALGSSGEALRKLWEALGKLRGTTILYNNNSINTNSRSTAPAAPYYIIYDI